MGRGHATNRRQLRLVPYPGRSAGPRIAERSGMRSGTHAVAIVLVAVAAAASLANEPRPGRDDVSPPMSPEEALRSFRLAPGLRVDLVAAEPLVVDPVAIDFGGAGKLLVWEMRDYPAGLDGNWKPGGGKVGGPRGGRLARGHRRQLEAGGRRQGPGRPRRRRKVRLRNELPRGPAIPDRRDGLATRGARLRGARDYLCRGPRRRRQG